MLSVTHVVSKFQVAQAALNRVRAGTEMGADQLGQAPPAQFAKPVHVDVHDGGDPSYPDRIPSIVSPGASLNAVDVVCDRIGRVRYVGSTVGRPARALLAEHLDDIDRTREWHEAWVIPPRASTPEAIVRSIEGRVGRFLRPSDSQSLPRPKSA